MSGTDIFSPPTLDGEVTPDYHQVARRENNSNWCLYAKTKTRLIGAYVWIMSSGKMCSHGVVLVIQTVKNN